MNISFSLIKPVMRMINGREYIHLLCWLVVFLFSPSMLRYVDQTAAPLDPGIITAVILSVLSMLLFLAVTWCVICMLWPALARFSKNEFETQFNTLSPCLKIACFLIFYLVLLSLFVCTLAAIL